MTKSSAQNASGTAPLDPESLDSSALQRLEALNDPGTSDIIVELIEMFLQKTPVSFGKIAASLEKGDLATAASEAHALKSASACLGANWLSRLCAQMELESNEGFLDIALERQKALGEAFEKIKPALLETRDLRLRAKPAA